MSVLVVDREQHSSLTQPVGEEDRVDGRDDRPLDPGDQFLPLQSALDVLRRVVAAVDQVLRAHESDTAVDHDELAVIAQVGPLVLALEGHDRQHPAPLHADAIELGEGLGTLRHLLRGDVVGEQAHGDATLHGVLHGGEEAAGRVVHGDDEELDVHESLGGVDLPSHGIDRSGVVADQGRRVAAHDRDASQHLVLRGEVGEPLRPGSPVRSEIEPDRALGDEAGDARLLLPTAFRQLGRSDHQVQDDADVRQED